MHASQKKEKIPCRERTYDGTFLGVILEDVTWVGGGGFQTPPILLPMDVLPSLSGFRGGHIFKRDADPY